ncbi:MAG: SusC/RagA family TonB-linked outer membrane protein, partial [Draconibacterium sp.]|nr:SusC/RagA family TonB-linked outer membrane protein [Draconibacterium sp.]
AIDAFGAAPDKISWQGQEYAYPNNDVDYYDELMKNGTIQNHNLSIRGGSEKADYRVSASYYAADGRLINDHNYERMNVTNKINFQPYKFLKLGSTFTLVQDNNKNNSAPWAAMYNAVPILPMWEENGDYGQRSIYGYTQGSSTANPIVALDQSDKYGNYSKNTRIMYSAHAEVDFFSNDVLKLRSQVSQEINNGNSRSYAPQYESGVDWKRIESSLTKNYSEYRNFQIDNTLTFQKAYGNHNVTAMAGFSTRKVDSRSLNGRALGVPWGDTGREEFLYLDNGNTDSQIASDGGWSERGVSYISRLQYNYSHKYLLNATFRADGTDKYSETWGYFPSVGLGWVLSEEAFMQDQNIFDYAKIRASWGQLGNNNVPRESGSQSISFGNSYSYSYLYDGVLEQGYIANVDYNNLKWEVTTELNVGLDMAFLNDRLSIETDWYRKVTTDAAIRTNGIMGAGVTPSLIRNAGEILNTGLEFVVDWNDKIGDFGYSISANMTSVHNEVLKLSDEYINEGSIERRIRSVVGEPLYSFWGREVIGIYQNQAEIDEHLFSTADGAKPVPGYFKYEDVNEDGVITTDDYQFLGANIPKFTYGGNIALDYKNWDFSVKFYGVYGNKIANGDFNLRSVRSHHTEQNFDKALYENRWTQEGDNTSKVDGLYYPSAAALTVGNSWNFNQITSFVVEDGSFFKVNNVTLGYTFKNIIPGSEKGSSVRIKFAADNPISFFKYNGFDPNVAGMGRDSNTYPNASNYILGVNITY